MRYMPYILFLMIIYLLLSANLDLLNVFAGLAVADRNHPCVKTAA